MPGSSKPSASIIVSAVVAILGSILVFAGNALGLFTLLVANQLASSQELPGFARNMAILSLLIGVAASVTGIATGVCLFLLRRWARISMLSFAGLCVFFGVVGIPVAIFTSLQPDSGLPVRAAAIARILLFLIYLLPLSLGAWWLILFTRPSIKSQFAQQNKPAAAAKTPVAPASPSKPRGPILITGIAWLLIGSAANVFILPLIPFRVPILLFGHLYTGSSATLLIIANSLLLAIAGVGLLKLKRWSFLLTIALHVVWLVSAILTAFSPNFDLAMTSMLKEMTAAMHLPPSVPLPLNLFHHMRWLLILSLPLPIFIIGALFHYRQLFLNPQSRNF